MAQTHFPIFFALSIGWFLYVFCRKTFSSTMPQLTYDVGFTKDQLGTIASSFSLAYGISKFLGAIISDHSDLGRLFSIGLFLTGITTLIFPLGATSVTYCSIVIFLLGTFQGAGWPAIAKLLKVRFPPDNVGLYWSLVSCAGSFAAAVSPVLVAKVAIVMDWYCVYYSIGGISVILSIVIYFVIPAGSPPTAASMSSGMTIGYTDLLFKVDLWLVSWVYFFLYLLKNTLCDWGQLYFIQEFGYEQPSAAFCVGMFLLGGTFGNIAFGYFSDYLLKRLPANSHLPRSPSLLLSCILFAIFLYTFIFSFLSELSTNLIFFLLGFAVDGGVAVVGLIAMDTVPDHMTGMAHGLACAWAQVGTLVSGWPFSLLVLNYGWKNSLIVLEFVSVFTILLCTHLSYKTLTHVRKQE